MPGDYLLDTNVGILFMAGEAAVRDRVARADSVSLPFAVLGELYYGALESSRIAQNLARVEQLRRDVPLIGWDGETARRYGEIKKHLREKGKPIPDNDVWIAAVTLRHDLTLATRDAHFDEIEGLKHERW